MKKLIYPWGFKNMNLFIGFKIWSNNLVKLYKSKKYNFFSKSLQLLGIFLTLPFIIIMSIIYWGLMFLYSLRIIFLVIKSLIQGKK